MTNDRDNDAAPDLLETEHDHALKSEDQGSLPSTRDQSLAYMLRVGHRGFSRLLEDRIAQHGVSLSQWYFLRVLWEQDGLTQAEVAKRAGMMTSNTATAMATLERQKLIVRRQHPTDRRKTSVYLTGAGRQLKSLLVPIASEVTETAVKGIDPELLSQIKAALIQIRKNIEQALDNE